ncbi:MAG: 2-oxo-4-hydroxy-4-carboxy-5-ureidoimidazoline decarboxylase [Acidobacteriota bacterium]
MTLDEFNVLDAEVAEREVLHCCGSRRWAREMAGRRPFTDRWTLDRDADSIWRALAPVDWFEAFAAHPRIGDTPRLAGEAGGAGESPTAGEAGGTGQAGDAGRTGGAGGTDRTGHTGRAGAWAAREQAGMDAATEDIRQRLAAVNRRYEDRFGFIYLVCATGKTAEEMLAIAEGRLRHTPDEELHTAAEEQRKITRIRLEKLIP